MPMAAIAMSRALVSRRRFPDTEGMSAAFPGRPSERQRPARIPAGWRSPLVLGLMLLLGGLSGGVRAGADEAETDGSRQDRILIEAVEAAAGLDFYNARCRGDGSGRHTDNLNKLLVSRQRTTVLRVQDERFPERDYRRVQERLADEQQAMLNAAGGCQEARKTELPGRLRERYETAMQAVRSLP